MKEIKAWETGDGTIFRYPHEALAHEKEAKEEKVKKLKWSVLKSELEKKLGVSVYTDGSWNCPTSPIGECVYESDCIEKYGDECCYYCGEPEERK